MYCPQCGIESTPDLSYCRSCGANLKVIGKAVTLSEAIARSDRGPLPKIKEMMKSIRIDQVTDDISHALDQMNKEIVHSSGAAPSHEMPWWARFQMREGRSPERRRENHLVKGTMSLFSGVGVMIFLYYLTSNLILHIPPDALAKIPFELDPVVKIFWLVGLIPALSGLGRIIAGLLIKVNREALPPHRVRDPQQMGDPVPESPSRLGSSVTENTTELLGQKGPVYGAK
jgi:hypothetical protein